MTTSKTIDLTRWTFVGTVMSLLLNMLSMLVITFLSRSKHLLITWLKLPSAVILEPKKSVLELKQIFLHRRHTDGKQTHDKMLNISQYQINANQNHNEVP